MSDYGVFEASSTDGYEEEQHRRKATADLGRAIEAAREGFGDFLGAAENKQDYKDRLALVMNDLMQKVADSGVMPVPGVMRKVKAALRPNFKQANAIDYYKQWCEETGRDWGEPSNVDLYGEEKGLPGYVLHDISDQVMKGADEVPDYGKEASRKQAADYSGHSYDQLVDEYDTLRQQYADWEIDQSEYKSSLAEIEAEAERRGLTLASRKEAGLIPYTTEREGYWSYADFNAQVDYWIKEEGGRFQWSVSHTGDVASGSASSLEEAEGGIFDFIIRKNQGGADQAIDSLFASRKQARTEEEIRKARDDLDKQLTDALDEGGQKEKVQELRQKLRDINDELSDSMRESSRKRAGYNGWSNLDTWEIVLILGKYLDIYGELGKVSDANHLREIVESLPEGEWVDFSQVNWQELYDSYKEDGAITARRKQAVSSGGYSLTPVYGDDGLEYYSFVNDVTGREMDTVYPYETDSDGQWLELSASELEAELEQLAQEFGDPRQASRKQADLKSNVEEFLGWMSGHGYSLPRDAGYPGDNNTFDDELWEYVRTYGGDENAMRQFLIDNWDFYAYGVEASRKRANLRAGSRKVALDWNSVQEKVEQSGWDPMYADYIAWALDNGKNVEDTYSFVDYSDLLGLDAEDEQLLKKFIQNTAPRLYGSRQRSSSRKLANDYQFDGGWSARVVYDSDDEGEYEEAILTGPGGVSETIYPWNGRTFDRAEIEEQAREIITDYGDSVYQDTYQYNSRRKQALGIDGSWEEDLPGIGYAKCTPKAGGGFELYMWSDTMQNEALEVVSSPEEARRVWQEWRRSDIGPASNVFNTDDNYFLGHVKHAGGTDFATFAQGSSAQEAFNNARAEAKQMYGDDGYTGSIAEKDSFEMASRTPMTEEEARKFIWGGDGFGKFDDKWGPAGCIELDTGGFVFFGIAST